MTSIGGRITSTEINGSSIKLNLDRTVPVSAQSKFYLTKNTGEVFSAQITSATNTDHVLVSASFNANEILPYSTWVLNPRFFKVIKINEQDKKTRFQITAIQHFPEKYDFIDTSATFVSAN